ncbi:hypothetical protein GPEL0_01f2806 [Geoanaerobacter pelophilus]|uniref:Uncharacterized protein n=1 Tax=Geoanaerobacter pelophilus TaxID=60036 RepID=A0ABQ0MJ78_9BACT|nr:hypothetical protein GPEL0_01f2806 [Geoanaerobacter pelophilus]
MERQQNQTGETGRMAGGEILQPFFCAGIDAVSAGELKDGC